MKDSFTADFQLFWPLQKLSVRFLWCSLNHRCQNCDVGISNEAELPMIHWPLHCVQLELLWWSPLAAKRGFFDESGYCTHLWVWGKDLECGKELCRPNQESTANYLLLHGRTSPGKSARFLEWGVFSFLLSGPGVQLDSCQLPPTCKCPLLHLTRTHRKCWSLLWLIGVTIV